MVPPADVIRIKAKVIDDGEDLLPHHQLIVENVDPILQNLEVEVLIIEAVTTAAVAADVLMIEKILLRPTF